MRIAGLLRAARDVTLRPEVPCHTLLARLPSEAEVALACSVLGTPAVVTAVRRRHALGLAPLPVPLGVTLVASLAPKPREAVAAAINIASSLAIPTAGCL